MDGWIKTYRKMLANPMARKPKYLAVWVYILLNAEHEDRPIIFKNEKIMLRKGQLLTSVRDIGKFFNFHHSSVYVILHYLEYEHMIRQDVTSSQRLIEVQNWEQYQGVRQEDRHKPPSNPTRTAHSPILVNYKENTKNKSHTCDSALVQNPEIELILSLFQKHTGHKPTDKYPRRVAQNLRMVTKTLIRDITPYYPADKIQDIAFEALITRAFAWYDKRNEMKGEKLETWKLAIKNMLYEATRKKYIPNYGEEVTHS